MEIRIRGKFERSNRHFYTQKDIDQIPWIGEGFVFVDYLNEDIFLHDVFVPENGKEIILREIKLQFDTKEPLTMMGRGWKCLCRFDNLDLENITAVKDWFASTAFIMAKKKN